MFSHNLPMHFAVNMLVLYSFGPLTVRMFATVPAVL